MDDLECSVCKGKWEIAVVSRADGDIEWLCWECLFQRVGNMLAEAMSGTLVTEPG